MSGIAVLDVSKGHHDHGKLTVHTEPGQCTIVPTLSNTTAVALSTGLNGAVIGQWVKCGECAEIESARQFITGS